MNVLALLAGILGLSTNNVLMINQTGLKIVRIEVSGRRFELVDGKVDQGQILIHVTPEKHSMAIFFLGGGDVKWPEYDFKGVHEVIFYRTHTYEIRARSE